MGVLSHRFRRSQIEAGPGSAPLLVTAGDRQQLSGPEYDCKCRVKARIIAAWRKEPFRNGSQKARFELVQRATAGDSGGRSYRI